MEQGKPTGKMDASLGGKMALAVIAALVAAVVGGVIWALVAHWTDYEYGYVAWGIGILVGLAVLYASGKRRGNIGLQVIAVLASLLGIAIGKYGIFYDVYREVVGQEFGAEAMAEVTLFHPAVREFFTSTVVSTLEPMDGLFIVLAVVTAWGILAKQKNVKEEEEPEAPAKE